MGLSDYLNGTKPESSLRLNLFLVTICSLTVILALAFHIFYITLYPVVTIWLGPHNIKYEVREVKWVDVAVFVTALGAFMFQLWYGKKVNKDAENNSIPGASSSTTETTKTTETKS